MDTHIIIAPDKFKGSMNARQAAQAIARGIVAEVPDKNLVIRPLSDGGEGLVDSLLRDKNDIRVETIVLDPLGKKIRAKWGIIAKCKTAVMEMSSASGLMLLEKKMRNPGVTSSYGTGELIREALNYQCPRIIIGLGGSATNDGGLGMAQALGIKFYDHNNAELNPGGFSLLKLKGIDTTSMDKRLHNTEIIAACDVNNPLTGDYGASLVYSPQKGASPQDAANLEKALRHYAQVITEVTGLDVSNLPGAGAAGGLGAGLFAFWGAKLEAGVNLVLDMLQFETLFPGCELIITGEGKMDTQTIFGKVPVGLAQRASPYNIPVVSFTGTLDGDPLIFHKSGITATFALAEGPITMEESIRLGSQLLERKAREVIRFWQTCRHR